LIFPVPESVKGAAEKNRKYESFLQKANDLWDEFTTGRKPGKEVSKNGNQERNMAASNLETKNNTQRSRQVELKEESSRNN
jgi:hypothetical protein